MFYRVLWTSKKKKKITLQNNLLANAKAKFGLPIFSEFPEYKKQLGKHLTERLCFFHFPH